MLMYKNAISDLGNCDYLGGNKGSGGSGGSSGVDGMVGAIGSKKIVQLI